VFLQAGVGGFAAAAVAHLSDQSLVFVVVEPERVACVFESGAAGHAVTTAHAPPTVMAMLECQQPSVIALDILDRRVRALVTLPEAAAGEAMRALAFPAPGDPAIVAGESGAAGLADCWRWSPRPNRRAP